MNKQFITYHQTQSKRSHKVAKWVISIFIITGIFHSFIANDDPLVASREGSVVFPVIEEILKEVGLKDAKILYNDSYTWAIFPLIPYASTTINSRDNVSVGPFDNQDVSSIRYRHWLGTDNLGRDVAAGMVYGSHIAMLVGLFAIAIALFIGIFLGVFSGYFGDDGWTMNIYQVFFGAIIKLVGFYYLLFPMVSSDDVKGLYYVMVIGLIGILLFLVMKYGKDLPGPKIKWPIDLIITKMNEVVNSIPTLFIILASLVLFSSPSVWNVILVIGLLGWTTFARFIRAEVLQLKNLEFVQSAKSIGLSDMHIIMKHILPNALTSVISIIAFSISGAILLEASLSFLGIGVPIEQVSWGSMLASARADFNSWWLALFPGLAIFAVLLSFYTIGSNWDMKK